MPNVKTVSFGPGNGDLEGQQAELQRRQMMIDALRKQGMTPQDTQVVSGRAIKTSPWQIAAQLAQIGASTYAQKKMDTQQAELTTEKGRRQAEMLKSLAPAGTFDDAQPAGTAPESFDPNAPQGAKKPAVDPETRALWARALTVYQQDKSMGEKMILDLTNQTNDQKNWKVQGLDPRAVGLAALRKDQAGGLVNVAPGATVLQAGENKPVYAAPNFATGQNNSFGPNGQPQISRMQGAEVIPQMAGEIKGAEAAAQAQNEMITVDTPQGPRMMTRAQAVQMSGGQQQAPASPAPANPGNFTASNGMVINLTNTPPDQLLAAAKASGDPAAVQAAQEYMQRQGQPQQGQQGAPMGQPQAPGIALQSPAQKAQQVGDVENAQAVERARLLNAQSPEALQKLADSSSVLELLGDAKTIIAQGKATGSTLGSMRDKVGGMIGVSTPASQASAKLKVIGGSLTAKIPKMPGATSDRDMALYMETAGRIGDETLPLPDRMAALEQTEKNVQKLLAANKGSIADKALEANKAGIGTPSVDSLLKQYLKKGP